MQTTGRGETVGVTGSLEFLTRNAYSRDPVSCAAQSGTEFGAAKRRRGVESDLWHLSRFRLLNGIECQALPMHGKWLPNRNLRFLGGSDAEVPPPWGRRVRSGAFHVFSVFSVSIFLFSSFRSSQRKPIYPCDRVFPFVYPYVESLRAPSIDFIPLPHDLEAVSRLWSPPPQLANSSQR